MYASVCVTGNQQLRLTINCSFKVAF